MKRLMTIALLLLAGLTVSAQGKWSATNYAADELKGQRAYTAYQYSDPNMGSYVSWGWDDPDFRLVTSSGIFTKSLCYAWYGQFYAFKVLVGIYNGKGELQEKFFLFMESEASSLQDKIHLSSIKPERKKAKKIIKALTKDKGLVRFVCARYDQADFDLYVPYFR